MLEFHFYVVSPTDIELHFILLVYAIVKRCHFSSFFTMYIRRSGRGGGSPPLNLPGHHVIGKKHFYQVGWIFASRTPKKACDTAFES